MPQLGPIGKTIFTLQAVRSLCALTAIIVLCNTVTVRDAAAHAEYVRSNPAFQSVVENPPSELSIWFSQELQQDGNWVDVIDQQGESVIAGPAYVSTEDPKRLTVPLKTLKPGSYLVNWHNISLEDDDPADGTFSFQVGPSAIGGTNASWITWLSLILSLAAMALALSTKLQSKKRG